MSIAASEEQEVAIPVPELLEVVLGRGASDLHLTVGGQRTLRLIPYEIKSLDDLALPSVVADLARYPRGFVVVTGPTGSGKSTTLAGMVDIVNKERQAHIMTVEDPIEFPHRTPRCIVNQREVGADTHSFSAA